MSVADRESYWRKPDFLPMNEYQEDASRMDYFIFDQLTHSGIVNLEAANLKAASLGAANLEANPEAANPRAANFEETNFKAANPGTMHLGEANPKAVNSGAANPQLILNDTCDGIGHLMSSLSSTNVVILKQPQTTAETDSSHALVLQEEDVDEEDTNQEGDTEITNWENLSLLFQPRCNKSQQKTMVIGG